MFYFTINGQPLIPQQTLQSTQNVFAYSEMHRFNEFILYDHKGEPVVSNTTGLYLINQYKLASDTSILEDLTSMSMPLEFGDYIIQFLNLEINTDTFDSFGFCQPFQIGK